MKKPLCIDLFCGLGGWAHGFLAEGYDVVGFDVERHVYGDDKYPAQLVLQDVLTLHGSQFRNAAVIVASPPCQAYSYRAMPWKRAKALPPPDNSLFESCFRIAREAGVPLVVENVKGAQPWVGRAQAHFGSFYLWGDVHSVGGAIVGPVPRFGEVLRAGKRGAKVPGLAHGTFPAGRLAQGFIDGRKVPGFNQHEETGKPGGSFQSAAVKRAGLKCGGDWFSGGDGKSDMRHHSSQSSARKAASAQIAKIPFPLAQHIASVFKP